MREESLLFEGVVGKRDCKPVSKGMSEVNKTNLQQIWRPRGGLNADGELPSTLRAWSTNEGIQCER